MLGSAYLHVGGSSRLARRLDVLQRLQEAADLLLLVPVLLLPHLHQHQQRICTQPQTTVYAPPNALFDAPCLLLPVSVSFVSHLLSTADCLNFRSTVMHI